MRFGGGDLLTWRQLQSSVLVTGVSGSGKTTLLDVLFRELARSGAAIYSPASKPGEGERLAAVAAGYGRTVRVIDRTAALRINFLAEVLGPDWRADVGTSALHAATAFDQVAQALDRGGGRGGEGEAFWRGGYFRYLRNLLLLPLLAGHVPTVPMLLDVLRSAPRSPEDVGSEAFKAGLCSKLLAAGFGRAQADPHLRHDYDQCWAFFLEGLPREPEKTRGNFEQMILNPCDVLCRGLPHRLLSAAEPTLDLRRVVDNAEVLVSVLNPGEDHEVALAVNTAVKFLLMRQVLARRADDDTPPLVFHLDEYQCVMSSFDSEYLPRQRQSRGPFVAATQGLESIRQNFSGATGEAQSEVLTGNFATAVYCSPTRATAKVLVESLGSVRGELGGGGTQSNPYESPWDFVSPGPGSYSGNSSEAYVPYLTHSDLWNLRTGQDGSVDFIVTAPGKHPRLATIRRGD